MTKNIRNAKKWHPPGLFVWWLVGSIAIMMLQGMPMLFVLIQSLIVASIGSISFGLSRLTAKNFYIYIALGSLIYYFLTFLYFSWSFRGGTAFTDGQYWIRDGNISLFGVMKVLSMGTVFLVYFILVVTAYSFITSRITNSDNKKRVEE